MRILSNKTFVSRHGNNLHLLVVSTNSSGIDRKFRCSVVCVSFENRFKMAARRISQSAINWSAIAERVPPNQKSQFAVFKTKSDQYLRAVLANPENAPKIDWAHYKKIVPLPGLVDNFQKLYDGVKVPYPPDNVSAQVDAQAKETKSEVDKFKHESQQRIGKHEADIAHLKSLLPYDQMTMEDYRDAFPEAALDPINRPTFWPHNPEEQLGYKSKEQLAAEQNPHH